MTHLLILGGTREALQLAQQTVKNFPQLRVITSLAGRTQQPAVIPGGLRSGGFGGYQGFIDYLQTQSIDMVVNATHPFAAEISRYSAEACQQINIPYLRYCRPAWQAQSGDDWHCVDDIAAAAEKINGLGQRVFLACGRKEIEQFAGYSQIFFLMRWIEAGEKVLPFNHYQLILQRGPFHEDSEIDLLKRYQIDLVVSKNSGGSGAYGKIAAARKLAIPVIMIQRPAQPDVSTVGKLPTVISWIHDQLN